MEMRSYNGVLLPELPYWNKSVYPYALIRRLSSNGAYVLICQNKRPFCIKSGVVDIIALDIDVEVFGFMCDLENMTWVEVGPFDVSDMFESDTMYAYYIYKGSRHIWTNYDIAYKDGFVAYHSYEPKTYCPKSFKMGLSVGLGLDGIYKEVNSSV